jgi:cell wall-associated NlpC family hydrolase
MSGVAVGMAVAGGLLVWSGLSGRHPLDVLRSLARGEPPGPLPASSFQPVSVGTAQAAVTSVSSNTIVATAMRHRGRHPYRYGAGHGVWNCQAGAPLDCSAFASCVLHELGLLASPKNTTAFLAWSGATTVAWEQRQPGDLIIWPSHMGIAVSATEMIHTGGAAGCPCVVPYSQMRSGRKGVARRVKAGQVRSTASPASTAGL